MAHGFAQLPPKAETSRRIRRLCLVFFGLLVAGALVSSIAYEKIIRAQNNLILQFAMQEQAGRDWRVVIFGDSRAVYGIRQPELTHGYLDFSQSGEAYRGYYLRLYTLLKAGRIKDAIVIPFDSYSISSYRDVDKWNPYLHFAPLDEIVRTYRSRISNRLRFIVRYAEFYFPLLKTEERRKLSLAVLYGMLDVLSGRGSRRKHFDACLALALPAEGRRAWQSWEDTPPEIRESLALDAVKNKLDGKPLAPELVRVVERMIELAHRHGVRVIGVRMPLSREWLEAEPVYADPAIDAAYRSLDVDLVLDYRRMFASRPELFFDGDHLDKEGARLFSRILTSDIAAFLGHDAGPRFDCTVFDHGEAYRPSWPYRIPNIEDLSIIGRILFGSELRSDRPDGRVSENR